ncbi:MAG TPA: type-F conjugative transfer system secretin TraK [Arsenophonus nasoniae]|uniref:type-F conjugative transfer system secretin TraK n=1 Tax=Arsenophonus nasoniae TaxID=638 RepID=UPI0038795F5C
MQRLKFRMRIIALLMGMMMPEVGQAITTPTVITLPDGGQAAIAFSSSEANLLTIAGDRITAVIPPVGVMQNLKSTANGSVVFTALGKKPFTFVVETERGHNFSLRAVPTERTGRTIQIVSQLGGVNSAAKTWEQTQPYEALLVDIQRRLLAGLPPTTYQSIPVTRENLPTPLGFSAKAEKVWAGHQLKVIQFTVTNQQAFSRPVVEANFWQPGTRAIGFSHPVQALAAGQSMSLFVIRSDEVTNGEH